MGFGQYGYRAVTPFGRRDVDVALPGVRSLFEVKASKYVTADSRIRQDIQKDAYIVSQGYTVEWHIYPDERGRAEVSQPLVDQLDAAGINVIVHHFGGCHC